MKIVVSTIAFRDLSIEEIIQHARNENWAVEFSSGVTFRPDLIDLYLKAEIERIPHNYFPPPRIPFVLNLASNNEQVREKSIQHCIQGLELAKASNAPFFSAHAGFCGDPKPEELGHRINFPLHFDRASFWRNFVRSVSKILAEAERLETDFLIENNVCAKFNLQEPNRNPLLCADASEITALLLEVSHPRLGILLDTGHLKVSAQTLGFDPLAAVDRIKSHVRGIHHSDNNGIDDSNDLLTSGYWFLSQMQVFDKAIHVLEVKNLSIEEIRQQIMLIRS